MDRHPDTLSQLGMDTADCYRFQHMVYTVSALVCGSRQLGYHDTFLDNHRM